MILPLGVMTTFRFLDLLHEPLQISETIECEILDWNISRPSKESNINELVHATCSNTNLEANFALLIGSYTEDDIAYYRSDLFSMRIMINASTTTLESRIERMRVSFSRDKSDSVISWSDIFVEFKNLLQMSRAGGHTQDGTGEEAHIEMVRLGQPSAVGFSTSLRWVLQDLDSKIHEITLTYELIYSNKTAYNKITQPFRLTVTGR